MLDPNQRGSEQFQARPRPMSGDPNFNEIAAHVIEAQINNAIKGVSTSIRGAVSKILAGLSKDLKQYTAAKIRKCSYVRTPIINRDRPTPIYDVYVHTRLKVAGSIVEDDDFIAALRDNDSVVITGSAGSGKSMLMRHLFLALCSATNLKIPLFFELRDIDVPEKKTLREFLYHSLVGSNATITESQFHDGLKTGVFSLVLDGFDEINFRERKGVEREIRKLREQCPDLQIIISSRPDADRSVESWQDFRTVYVEPMNEFQSAELIKKLDYDVDVKEKFLREAEATLFKSHESFLSNPLLCVMMLVTFQQTGHIPTKRHVFYEQAFDALFSLHDSSKEGVYKRKTYAELSIDQFRNCMSAFCIVTYLKEKFSFSRNEFREALHAALKLEKLSINIDNLTNDMIESTCLIQIEGTDYIFTHRSFQEYFSAVYVSRSPAVGVRKLLDRVSIRQTDDVIQMAHSINRGLVERDWVIPTLTEVMSSPTLPSIGINPFGFIERYIGSLYIAVTDSGPSELLFHFNSEGIKLHAICAICSDLVSIPSSQLSYSSSPLDAETMNAVYTQMVLKRDSRLLGQGAVHTRKLSPKRGGPIRRTIQVSPEDNEWLIRTSVPSYLVFFASALRQILDACKESASSQKDIFAGL
jgi:hypothetical protein